MLIAEERRATEANQGKPTRIQPAPARRHVVPARLGYVVRPTSPALTLMYEPPAGIARQNYRSTFRECKVEDARWRTVPADIDVEGFELWDAPSELSDFWDEAQVTSVYYRECEELALKVTGASEAFAFDHQLRRREDGRPELSFGRPGDGKKAAAVGRVHNDYSEASGLKRLDLVLPKTTWRPPVQRYSIVNIWRSIGGPVLDTPLAVCDARTISVADAIVNTIQYQDRIGEIYLYQYAERHHWSFYSEMGRSEALVFKQFDSQACGVARFTPHVAFDLPTIPPDAPLRQSIEVRCLVTYD